MEVSFARTLALLNAVPLFKQSSGLTDNPELVDKALAFELVLMQSASRDWESALPAKMIIFVKIFWSVAVERYVLNKWVYLITVDQDRECSFSVTVEAKFDEFICSAKVGLKIERTSQAMVESVLHELKRKFAKVYPTGTCLVEQARSCIEMAL